MKIKVDEMVNSHKAVRNTDEKLQIHHEKADRNHKYQYSMSS